MIDLVVDPLTQKEMVLKRSNIDRENMFDTVKKEVKLLQKFAGPYLVKLLANDVGNKGGSREALLLLEYYPGGHLLDRLNSRGGAFLPVESIFKIFGQILLGLKPLHESHPPIIHRDIKLENVLFGPDGKVRLCDFGSCVESPVYLRNVSEKEQAEEVIQKETTPMYRAPEMADLYMRDKLTEKTDIWALGCLFFSLAFLKHPFQDVGSLGIIAGKYSIPADSPLSEDGHDFLRRMLDIDPEARPSIAELLTMLVELAAGRPLPAYELTAEAIKRREDRIAANQVRESKAKKKAAPVVPLRKGVPPSANSVAAKRLAAKRGQPLPSGEEDLFDSSSPTEFDTSPTAHSARSAPVGLAVSSFDPFGDEPAPAVTSQATPTADDFDPFADPGAKKSAAASLFGAYEDDHPAPVASAKKSLKRPSFEDGPVDFGQSHAPAHSAPAPAAASAGFDTFDAFGRDSEDLGGGDEFDPFAGPPAAAVAPAAAHTAPHSHSHTAASMLDFEDEPPASSDFDMFGSNSRQASFTATKRPSESAARPSFTAAPTAHHNDLLSAFETAPAPVPAARAPLLDIFSTDLLQPMATPAPAAPVPAQPSVSKNMGGGLSGGMDLLSLYDAPPAPKSAMLSQPGYSSMPGPAYNHPSSGMMMGGGPRPMMPMGMAPAAPSMGMGMGMGQPRGMPMGYGSAPMTMGGGMAMQQPPVPSYGRPAGQGAGPGAGRSADPFDSINILGRK